jgi:hypothetical protein
MAPLTHPARAALEQYNREHPGIWQSVDKARSRTPRDWPPQVFLPQERAADIMLERLGLLRDYFGPTLSERATALAMFAAWRTTQGIYRFDPDIYAALLATPLTGEIPVETLSCLPEWCVYIETPGMSWSDEGVRIEQQGLWACLDWQAGARVPLALAFALHVAPTIRFGHLPLAGTVERSLIELDVSNHGRRTIASPVAGTLPAPEVQEKARRLAQELGPILSLLLYLCSEAADIGDGTRAPQKPKPRYTKGLERMFPAPAPVGWSVGVRMGAALRGAQAREALAAQDDADGRRTVRPHVRRAHWAHRWTGPMTGERKTVVRWIHPALVNAGSPEDLPSVIRPVPGSPTSGH